MSDLPRFAARVASTAQETAIDRTFHLEIEAGGAAYPPWRPGQYVALTVLGEDPQKERPYSYSGAVVEGPPRITVRGGGSWGKAVYELAVGDPVSLRAPQGQFLIEAAPEQDILLVAGGAGVTPFRSALAAWAAAGATRRIVLFHTCSTQDRLLFESDMRGFAKQLPGFVYRPHLTQEPDDSAWQGVRARLDRNALGTRLRDGRRTVCYACGPQGLVADTMTWAEDLGIPEDLRRHESW